MSEQSELERGNNEMTYIITKITKDIFDSIYCDLVLQMLKDHGAVEITEDDYEELRGEFEIVEMKKQE